MAGYLDSYGVADQRREGKIKTIAIAVAVIAVAGLAGFLFFRTFSERRVANSFLDTLRAQDYAGAYRTWGCATPCRDYPLNKFMEDWGPKGVYAKAPAQGRYTISDICGEGVVFTLETPGTDPVGIWVSRTDHAMSFAPWPRCPGRHLHLWEFIRSRFS